MEAIDHVRSITQLRLQQLPVVVEGLRAAGSSGLLAFLSCGRVPERGIDIASGEHLLILE
jgi:hypothetical protein